MTTTQEEARQGADRSEQEGAKEGDQTAGQETYPGPRSHVATPSQTTTGGGDASADTKATGGNAEPGNETGLNADTPAAGDVDPDSTKSSEETGQDGDPNERKKSTGHPWNG